MDNQTRERLQIHSRREGKHRQFGRMGQPHKVLSKKSRTTIRRQARGLGTRENQGKETKETYKLENGSELPLPKYYHDRVEEREKYVD